MRRALVLLLAGTAAGCGPDLDPAWLVTKPRIIAAVTTVGGDATRSSPRPGERAEVRFAVIDAGDPPPALGWALIACLAAPTTNGDSFCDGAPFGIAAQMDPVAATPSITLDVPASVPAESTVLVIGAICAGGAPTFDMESGMAGCSGGAREMFVAHRLVVGTDNRNPTLADDAISLDGTPWPACVPALAEDPHVIAVTVPDDAREPEETLQLSTLTTARELERQFSVLEPEQPNAPFEIEWTPDAGLDPAVTEVRFWIVLRDGRGGATLTERTLCLTR